MIYFAFPSLFPPLLYRSFVRSFVRLFVRALARRGSRGGREREKKTQIMYTLYVYTHEEMFLLLVLPT